MLEFLLGLWLVLGPQNAGVLQGIVQRGGASDAISGVEISLISATSQTRLQTRSDTQGRFVLENVPLGNYRVVATREGYFTYPRGDALPYTVSSVSFDAPGTRRIVVDLVPGAVIAGRITDPQGQPLPGVRVSAAKMRYDDGRPAFGAGSLPKATDDRGEYRLFWLPPGEYYLRAEYGGAGSLARRSYYPGTLDSAATAQVTIRGGETMEGINFAIPTASAIRISGEVVFDGPGPAAGSIRTFYLLPRDGRPAEISPLEFKNILPPQANREKSGAFAIDIGGIAPGAYDLAPFFIEGSNVYRTGRTRLEIGDENIENVMATLSPNVDVVGRFLVTGENLSRNWSALRLQLRAREATIPLMNHSNLATIAADGTFVIRSVPEGLYQLYLGAAARGIPSDLYISDVRQGLLDIRNEGTLEVRASMLPLEITLSSGAGSVRGVVETPTGGVPNHADVVLVPQAPRRSNAMFYDRTTIDDKGQFTFNGTPPGEYKVFAFEQIEDTAELNPAFIARYESLGSALTVNPKSTAEVRLRLLR